MDSWGFKGFRARQQDFLYFIAKPFLCRQSKPKHGDCRGAAWKGGYPRTLAGKLLLFLAFLAWLIMMMRHVNIFMVRKVASNHTVST